MPAPESRGPRGATPEVLSAEGLLAQLQELIDSRPIGTPTPLDWAVSAHFLGDMNGLAGLTLRSEN